MSEDLNAEEAATEEEIAAVVPDSKAASRGKKFEAEPEAAAEVSVDLLQLRLLQLQQVEECHFQFATGDNNSTN